MLVFFKGEPGDGEGEPGEGETGEPKEGEPGEPKEVCHVLPAGCGESPRDRRLAAPYRLAAVCPCSKSPAATTNMAMGF